jgi:hypothetical protein
MRFKKSILLASLAGLLAATGAARAEQAKFFRIASAGAGGTYFAIARVIASAISSPLGARPCERGGTCGVPGLIAIALSTDGSVANVDAIQSGAIKSGFAHSDVTFWAYTATGQFAKQYKHDRLRVIANLYPEHVHVVIRANSGLKSIPDLRGRRLGLGRPASGARVGAMLILEAYGMKENVDYRAELLGGAQAFEAIRDDRLDATLTVSGFPNPGITELASEVGLDLLAISAAVRAKVKNAAPFYHDAVIPAGTYEGVDKDVQTLAVAAQWLVGSEVDAELVYQITRTLWNDATRELLDKGHAKGREIRLETALDAISIPLHPGAERYYREIGKR